MRKDSRWSDNSPVTARDFEWSWKRQLDPASAAPYASFLYDIKNGEKFNKKQLTDAKEVGVVAKDDWTLEVTLEGPRGYFPVLAAYLAALPAHRGAVEKHGDKWTEAGNIVSNGAFTLEAWEHNKQIVLRKNPYYYGAKNVHITRVVIPIIPVASGALPYENNELDMTALQAGDLNRLRNDARAGKDVFKYPFPGTWYLLPQTTKPPFDNLKVRKAVGHAIDRENIVKVSQGLAIPAWSMIPPGFPGALDDAKTKSLQKYDKKLAMEQLKGTPFEGGKNWPKITLTMRDEGLGSKPLAEAVQAVLLDSLNMKTELEVLEPRVFRERLWKQDLQFVWIRWFMDYPDPHNEYFDTFYGKKTTGKRQAWVNDAFDKELEAGRDTRDPKKRLEHYKKAEEIMQNDVGYVPVAWVLRYAAKKPWVAGTREEQAGRVRGGRQHLRGHAAAPLHPGARLGRVPPAVSGRRGRGRTPASAGRRSLRRCEWARKAPEIAYHDREWGVPLRDDRRLFEMLILEGAQAGLSWETILRKRAAYRRAFHRFNAHRIAKYNARDIRRLLADAGIVRNRLKIAATVANAKAFLAVRSGVRLVQRLHLDLRGRPAPQERVAPAPRRARLHPGVNGDEQGSRSSGDSGSWGRRSATPSCRRPAWSTTTWSPASATSRSATLSTSCRALPPTGSA